MKFRRNLDGIEFILRNVDKRVETLFKFYDSLKFRTDHTKSTNFGGVCIYLIITADFQSIKTNYAAKVCGLAGHRTLVDDMTMYFR